MSDQAKLEQIGHDLFELYISGELTLPKFQELYIAAEQACGDDEDALEMFGPLTKDSSWMEWIHEHSREKQRLHVA